MTIERVWLERDGLSFSAKPSDCGHFAIVEMECQACGANPTPVQGESMHIDGHDTYAADATCRKSVSGTVCGSAVGVLRCRVSTLFGLEEDHRVIHGRCRVY